MIVVHTEGQEVHKLFSNSHGQSTLSFYVFDFVLILKWTISGLRSACLHLVTGVDQFLDVDEF